MTYLIAGGDRVDAGKTTFSVGLLDRLDAVGFKPRAGNDYWFDHDDYHAAVETGRLYGKDARRLAAASDGDHTPEAINPIHRLWRPAPDGDRFIGETHRSFVLDRVGETFVVNANADIPQSARKGLALSDAPRVRTVEELNRYMQERYLPHLQALAEQIDRTTPAVVESYGDIARPLQGLSVRAVAVVEPQRVRYYEGDRYLNACEVTTGGPRDGQLEERVGDVTDMIDPVATTSLPALRKAEREDPARIATAYAEAYDQLLEIAP
ncbi:MAG: ATPase [Halobacteriales archaeon]|nr:ATPase [Halobacteriales archaeon]